MNTCGSNGAMVRSLEYLQVRV